MYNTIRSDYLNFKRFEKINLEKTFKLGMVARLSPQKDIKRFINLAENFSNNESFEFYLAGDGPNREEIELLLTTKKLKNFHYLGQIDLKKPKFYRDIDCLVLLSFYEGLPRSILEGMSQSLPLIVSDVGSIKDVFSLGQVGLLVKDKTTDNEIINFIKNIAENKKIYKNLAKRSFYTFIEKYSLNSFEKRYLNLYKKFIKNK